MGQLLGSHPRASRINVAASLVGPADCIKPLHRALKTLATTSEILMGSHRIFFAELHYGFHVCPQDDHAIDEFVKTTVGSADIHFRNATFILTTEFEPSDGLILLTTSTAMTDPLDALLASPVRVKPMLVLVFVDNLDPESESFPPKADLVEALDLFRWSSPWHCELWTEENDRGIKDGFSWLCNAVTHHGRFSHTYSS